jgi:hypothetical protein
VARRSDALIHLSEGAADHCEDDLMKVANFAVYRSWVYLNEGDQSEVYLNVVYLNVVYLNEVYLNVGGPKFFLEKVYENVFFLILAPSTSPFLPLITQSKIKQKRGHSNLQPLFLI